MDTSQLTGVLAPALTAFTDRLEIDAERSISHLHWLLSNGCDGVVVFGTTSEANSLSFAERKEFLERAMKGGVDPAKVILGAGCCSLPETVELSRHAVELGCAGVLLLPPFYYKGVQDAGLFRYFASVIERVADSRLRIYLYHIPPVSQVPFSLDLVERLIRFFPEVVVGIKDSSGDLNHTLQLAERFVASGFRIFAGNETHLLPSLQAGGKGCIAAVANVSPDRLQSVFQNWRKPEAAALQEDVNRHSKILRRYPLIPALKAILAQERNEPQWTNIRPPLVPLTSDQRDALFGELKERAKETP